MSNRAMARMYSGGGGYGGGGGDEGGLLGNIMELFGNNDITGGFTVDPATQQISATPFQAKGGFGSGRAKMRANALNAQTLGPAFNSQVEGRTQLDLQKLMAQHQQELEKIKSQHAIDLGKLASVQEAAKRMGISTDQYAGQLADQNAANALQKLQTEGQAANPATNPNVMVNAKNKALWDASGYNQNAPDHSAKMGEITAFPSPAGVNMNTLTGAVPGQEQAGGVIDLKTGQRMGGFPVSKDIPAAFKPAMQPVDPALKAAALAAQQSQINPMPTSFDPSQSVNPWDQDYGNQQGSGQGVQQSSINQVQAQPQQQAQGILPQIGRAAAYQGQGLWDMYRQMISDPMYRMLWQGNQQQQ